MKSAELHEMPRVMVLVWPPVSSNAAIIESFGHIKQPTALLPWNKLRPKPRSVQRHGECLAGDFTRCRAFTLWHGAMHTRFPHTKKVGDCVVDVCEKQCFFSPKASVVSV